MASHRRVAPCHFRPGGRGDGGRGRPEGALHSAGLAQGQAEHLASRDRQCARGARHSTSLEEGNSSTQKVPLRGQDLMRATSVSVPPVYSSKYQYNGLGHKIKRTDSNTGLPDKYYYYNVAWQCLEERNVSDGSVVYWYVWGTRYIDDLTARSVSGGSTTVYNVTDARFNTVTRL